MLGGTASSRLFQEIRERRGMAYSVYSYHSAYAECGQIGVYVGTRPENLEECLSIVREETAAMAAGDLRPGELERAKRHLTGRVLLALESTLRAHVAARQEPALGHGDPRSRRGLAPRRGRDARADRRARDAPLGARSSSPPPGSAPTRTCSTRAVAEACPTLQPAA